MHRLVLLATSPRLPAGLLTAQAWDLLRSAAVFAGAETDQSAAVRATWINVLATWVSIIGTPVMSSNTVCA